jgi:hypothetical protein
VRIHVTLEHERGQLPYIGVTTPTLIAALAVLELASA